MALLSNQNSKLGKLSSFSLPLCSCDKTMNKQCKKYCYANYMYRIYPGYRKKMMANFRAAKSDDFIGAISYELAEASYFVRLHVSGDFYSQAYLNKWMTIARRFPNHLFYCYTKAIRLDYTKRPSNLVVYLSDDMQTLQRHYARFDGVCSISFDKKPIPGMRLCMHQLLDKVTCGHCQLCMEKGNHIYFNKH